jgi:predicted PhzF superfamily epimerase YddE/YHI9
MRIPFWHVDAFTGSLFGGNPAGVCLLEAWPAAATMQKIAAENNLPETAFVVLRGAGTAELRWFTPAVEIDLCGHATLAAAHVLFGARQGHGPGTVPWTDWKATSVEFSTQSGPLVVEKRADLLVMDFPSRPALPCETPTVLLRGLGHEPVEVRGARDYLVVYASEADVRALSPDMAQLARIDRMGVIATAPAADPRDCDFVSRFFAPGVGIPEDPVTGSSHCTLVPYWARRLRKTTLHARQVSARGGELFCEDAGDRVKMGGRAVTYLAGEIQA